MKIEYHSTQPNILLKKLKTRLSGLTKKEYVSRLNKYGPNELPREKPVRKLIIFLTQFKSPLIYILLFAGIISIILNEPVDAMVIFGAVIINTIIGYIQENKASQALQKLRELVLHNAYVIRNGNEIQVNANELTIGDIIVIKSGNKIPADARLIEATNLKINESSLTGESIAVEKNIKSLPSGTSLADRLNMIYAGTICVKGSAKAIICEIGTNTEIGKIAELVSTTQKETTPLQKRLTKFSQFIGILIGIISVIVAIIGIAQGRDTLEMFLMGVSIAVASIPEGLIVGVTVILALGMQQLLKRKALTRKLVAAETLGSTTVICTDKTGTLTEGKMHVSEIIIGHSTTQQPTTLKNSKTIQLALKIGAICNEAIIENPHEPLTKWKIIGDPTEAALLSAASQASINKTILLKNEPKIAILPFDSANKFMITLHKKDNAYSLYQKGAAEKLLNKSNFYFENNKKKKLTKIDKIKLNNTYKKLTKRGLRVIGVATKNFKSRKKIDPNFINWNDYDNNLTFIGFIALKDPLRKEARDTIKICSEAGIRPVVITGDHKLTAQAIAKEIGLTVKESNILTGTQLNRISDTSLKKIVNKVNLYARVNPHHKLRIVKALQSKGEVVAMTGDGVNDSPALKAADIGIAVGEGTDIAKEASDIILLDSNFKTIVAAVKQGRVIFANIRKVITYLVSDSFSEVILIVGSIICGMPLALLPAQILWINIVNDGLPDFSLAFEKAEKGIMNDAPLSKNEPILSKEMKIIIFAAGIIRDIFIFSIFYYLHHNDYNIDYIRTLIFAMIGVDSLFYIFSLRNLREPIWKTNILDNKMLILAVLISFWLLIISIYWPPLQKALHTVPLSLNSWIVILLVAVSTIIMIEIIKIKFISKKTLKINQASNAL